MRTPFFTLVFLSIFSRLSAQEAAPSDIHNEIGLNFTSFLDEAIDFGGGNTTLDPYLFTYKNINGLGRGFRMGAGFKFNRSKGDPTGNFFDEDAKSSTSNMDLRFGSERQHKISNRWLYYYGFDGLMGFNIANITSDGAKIKTSSAYGGLGPVIGVQFMLSDRIGLLTEASFYLRQSFSEEETSFDSPFEPDDKLKTNSTNLNFQVPTNIYLFFRF